MIGYIQDISGTWRLKNFGKAFVSPYANLDLASTFEMQSQELGTVFELDGSAWLVDEDDVSYPLYRKDGLWQFNIRFPPHDGAAHDTAYQASCDSENIPIQQNASFSNAASVGLTPDLAWMPPRPLVNSQIPCQKTKSACKTRATEMGA